MPDSYMKQELEEIKDLIEDFEAFSALQNTDGKLLMVTHLTVHWVNGDEIGTLAYGDSGDIEFFPAS